MPLLLLKSEVLLLGLNLFFYKIVLRILLHFTLPKSSLNETASSRANQLAVPFSGLESLQMPPTPPSSHGSDSEGSQSPVHAPPGLSRPTSPTSPPPTQSALKTSPRAASCLSNSPLLTAPHVSLVTARWHFDNRTLQIFVKGLVERVSLFFPGCRNFRAPAPWCWQRRSVAPWWLKVTQFPPNCRSPKPRRRPWRKSAER